MLQRKSEEDRFAEALGTLVDRTPGFYNAPWLKSPFEAPIWRLELGGEKSTLDFRVKLDDGLELSHPKHDVLLKSMKCFLLLQTHLDVTRGVAYSSSTTRARINLAVHICEYLLINQTDLKLAKFGLQAFSESDGYRMLKRLARFHSSEGIYRWPERLAAYLRVVSAKIPPAVVQQCIEDKPELGRTDCSTQLNFSHDELIRARVWLWTNGYYTKSYYDDGYQYTVDANMLSPLLYPNGTLRTTWKKSSIPELHIFAGPALIREKPSAPVRGEARAEGALRVYIKVLQAFPHLEKIGLPFPTGLLQAIDNTVFIQQLDMEPPGRYATLPHELVLSSLRNALEFSLEYGEELLDVYAKTAELAMQKNIGVDVYLASHSLDDLLGPNLKRLGTKYWSVARAVRLEYGRGRGGLTISEAEQQYFTRLRRGEGLFELLQILGGSILIILGALMARRQGELMDLVCGDMFDGSGTRLKFAARKRGVQDYRQQLLRPIPPVAADLLRKVERFQLRLVAIGVIKQRTALMSFPRQVRSGLSHAVDSSLNRMLDRFCDYFEVSINKKGQRHYIRLHQLRRFFAILFFWGNAFSGLDTLRWFLGHSDTEHLYNYISESIPGAILRSVKVDYAVERIEQSDTDCVPLLDLVEKQFGTRNVKILDEQELGEYIEELLITGQVTIEPQFFDGPDGKEYRIMIAVTSQVT